MYLRLRNQSSETENLINVSFYHLLPITPLLHGIGLPGSRADGTFFFIEVVLFKASSLIAQLVKNPPAMWETLG